MTEDRVSLTLSSLVHTTGELNSVYGTISHLVKPIKTKLEEVTRHQVEAVPTGSVFERFGKSLAATNALESNLATDYDVMFAVNKSSLQVETLMKNDEFLHIFVLTDTCSLLNNLKERDDRSEAFKLSAVRAREFMARVVRSSELEQEGKRPLRRFLRNLVLFQVNLPRLSRCRILYLSHRLIVDLQMELHNIEDIRPSHKLQRDQG